MTNIENSPNSELNLEGEMRPADKVAFLARGLSEEIAGKWGGAEGIGFDLTRSFLRGLSGEPLSEEQAQILESSQNLRDIYTKDIVAHLVGIEAARGVNNKEKTRSNIIGTEGMKIDKWDRRIIRDIYGSNGHDERHYSRIEEVSKEEYQPAMKKLQDSLAESADNGEIDLHELYPQIRNVSQSVNRIVSAREKLAVEGGRGISHFQEGELNTIPVKLAVSIASCAIAAACTPQLPAETQEIFLPPPGIAITPGETPTDEKIIEAAPTATFSNFGQEQDSTTSIDEVKTHINGQISKGESYYAVPTTIQELEDIGADPDPVRVAIGIELAESGKNLQFNWFRNENGIGWNANITSPNDPSNTPVYPWIDEVVPPHQNVYAIREDGSVDTSRMEFNKASPELGQNQIYSKAPVFVEGLPFYLVLNKDTGEIEGILDHFTMTIVPFTPVQIEPTPQPTSTTPPTPTEAPTPTPEIAQDWENIAGIGMDYLPRSWRWDLNVENFPMEDGSIVIFTAKPQYDLAVVEKRQMSSETTRFILGFLGNGEQIKVQLDSTHCELKRPNGRIGEVGLIDGAEVGDLAAIWLVGLEEEINVEGMSEWSEDCKRVWRSLRPDENLKADLAALFSGERIPEGWQGENGVIDLTNKVTLSSIKGK